MSLKHSIASKKRWAKISKEERSRRMSLLIRKRWSKISPKKRREYSRKMHQAKLLKNQK